MPTRNQKHHLEGNAIEAGFFWDVMQSAVCHKWS